MPNFQVIPVQPMMDSSCKYWDNMLYKYISSAGNMNEDYDTIKDKNMWKE